MIRGDTSVRDLQLPEPLIYKLLAAAVATLADLRRADRTLVAANVTREELRLIWRVLGRRPGPLGPRLGIGPSAT